MASTIKFKRSAVDGKIPTLADLELGEMAINTYMGKMFIKRDRNGVEEILQIGSEIAVGTTPPANPSVGDLWIDTN